MSKPKSRREAHLKRNFELEQEMLDNEAQLGRDAREARRTWKRQTSKLHRRMGKEEIQQALEGDDE